MRRENEQTTLDRSISLPMLVAYGVGTMVGAGFYALLGRVASHAEMHTPLAFLIAAAIALVTALSFGELVSRFPSSAGEARYVLEAFKQEWLAMLIGWGVITTGVVSAATLARAFAGFTQDIVSIPTELCIVLLVIVLTGIAIRGILHSVLFAVALTVIEVGGLTWVLAINARYLSTLPERWTEFVPGATWESWSGISVAAFLSFYAFIGFEDMVNEAEEVHNPRRNVPIGILLALVITTALYVLIAIVAVLAIDPAILARSKTPLALLVAHQGEAARIAMTVVSLLAGVNGALVQLIMASRVTYGMSQSGLGLRALATVHETFKTPVRATALMGGVILVFALWLPLETLARITSAIMLLIFAVVNASLIRIKLDAGQREVANKQYPLCVPVLGCVLCLTFLLMQFFVT